MKWWEWGEEVIEMRQVWGGELLKNFNRDDLAVIWGRIFFFFFFFFSLFFQVFCLHGLVFDSNIYITFIFIYLFIYLFIFFFFFFFGSDVLRIMFEILYDEDVILEEAYFNWEKSEDSAEQEGKGVALKQVVAFLNWLHEAEDDDDED